MTEEDVTLAADVITDGVRPEIAPIVRALFAAINDTTYEDGLEAVATLVDRMISILDGDDRSEAIGTFANIVGGHMVEDIENLSDDRTLQ